MQLIVQVKLMTTPEQARVLKHTLETANAACNHISQRAWEAKTFRQYHLHYLLTYSNMLNYKLFCCKV